MNHRVRTIFGRPEYTGGGVETGSFIIETGSTESKRETNEK